MKLAAIKAQTSYGEIGSIKLDWVKHEGFRVMFYDPGAGGVDKKYYAKLSSALSAMARVARKLGA